MDLNLSENLKRLRKKKGVSQEKLAQYLNVSYQAVSKWETDNAYPDISLLPEIARFFGITVDDLLQVKKIDEVQLYSQYEKEAEELFRNGKYNEVLELWKQAYREMPNNVQVKEMLMSAYYDSDKTKYVNEIVELGMELYNSDIPMYYKGQAVREIATAYAAVENKVLAEKWAKKSISIFNAQEILFTEISDGEELLRDVGFCTYWFFNCLFYMAANIDKNDLINKKTKKEVYKTLSQLYEVLYPNDDMDFESLRMLYIMHRRIAELSCDEKSIKDHIERAFLCVRKSVGVQEHDLALPMLYGWHIQAAPIDNKQYVRLMQKDLADSFFDPYRKTSWFAEIEHQLAELL